MLTFLSSIFGGRNFLLTLHNWLRHRAVLHRKRWNSEEKRRVDDALDRR
jgi:hypothetical protein